MKSLTIAFCDDDPLSLQHISRRVTELFAQHDIAVTALTYSNAQDLAHAMVQLPFALLFLDIDMPATDGIQFGEKLRSLGSDVDIIYISNMETRVYEVFRANPWSFVRKNHFDEEIPGVIQSYVRFIHKRTKQLILQDSDGSTQAIRPETVVYVESSGKLQMLFFHDKNTPLYIRCSLHELEESLSPYGFIRTHKGFLVNYLCIRKITSRGIVLEDGSILPIGRDRIQHIRERYLSLMKWKGSLPVQE